MLSTETNAAGQSHKSWPILSLKIETLLLRLRKSAAKNHPISMLHDRYQTITRFYHLSDVSFRLLQGSLQS